MTTPAEQAAYASWAWAEEDAFGRAVRPRLEAQGTEMHFYHVDDGTECRHALRSKPKEVRPSEPSP